MESQKEAIKIFFRATKSCTSTSIELALAIVEEITQQNE
jgi:hypothetical protein